MSDPDYNWRFRRLSAEDESGFTDSDRENLHSARKRRPRDGAAPVAKQMAKVQQLTPTRSSQVLTRLRRIAPAMFCDPPRPLAIGAGGEVECLLAGEFGSRDIWRGLARWTGRPGYQGAIASGVRYHVDGIPAGEITKGHAAHAAERLAKLPARSELRR